MEGTIRSFRRGKHTYKPRQFIIAIKGIETKEEVSSLLGKSVVWYSPQGKEIKGVIKATHGGKGLVRAIFERGLPGQAINSKVKIV